MKLLISPAKSLNFQRPLPTQNFTEPSFVKEAFEINKLLKMKSSKSLEELMNISEKLATLNWERNQVFSLEGPKKGERRAAVYAFNGDVYIGLDAYTLFGDKIEIMQSKLRILSGLYGILRPLDQIQPYRLEMGTPLKIGSSKNLYEFWSKKVTDQLNNELGINEILVNLASNEYFSVINTKDLKTLLINPVFKDFKNGKLKIISFYAKKARGMMARHLIEKNATTLEDILTFQKDGYRYSDEETNNELNPVFVR